MEPLMSARGTDRLTLAYTEFAAAEGLHVLSREFKAYVQVGSGASSRSLNQGSSYPTTESGGNHYQRCRAR